MNVIGFVVLFVVYTAIAIGAAVWHYSVDASLGGGLVILHVFNIGIGLYNLGVAIACGIDFGWKS